MTSHPDHASRMAALRNAIGADAPYLAKKFAEALAYADELAEMLKVDDEQKATKATLEAMAPEADTGPVQAEIRGAEETNRKIRENKERALVREELQSADKHARELGAEIERLEGEKQGLLEEAKLPVPGLGFDDHGPTLNGLPLDQASQAERLRVSVAIGIALNPRIKVLLVRDGSLLDEESMRMLTEAARDAEAQVWLEKVSETGEGCSVVIEDGEIKASATAAAE